LFHVRLHTTIHGNEKVPEFVGGINKKFDLRGEKRRSCSKIAHNIACNPIKPADSIDQTRVNHRFGRPADNTGFLVLGNNYSVLTIPARMTPIPVPAYTAPTDSIRTSTDGL
jgi:hypothetical protein